MTETPNLNGTMHLAWSLLRVCGTTVIHQVFLFFSRSFSFYSFCQSIFNLLLDTLYNSLHVKTFYFQALVQDFVSKSLIGLIASV